MAWSVGKIDSITPLSVNMNKKISTTEITSSWYKQDKIGLWYCFNVVLFYDFLIFYSKTTAFHGNIQNFHRKEGVISINWPIHEPHKNKVMFSTPFRSFSLRIWYVYPNILLEIFVLDKELSILFNKLFNNETALKGSICNLCLIFHLLSS